MRTKVLLATLLVLAIALPAHANQKPVTFSIKGGIDYSNLDYDMESYDSNNLLGFGGGITLGTAMQPHVGIDLDVLYIRKGASQEYRSGSEMDPNPLTIETKLDYITFSPMLRLSPGRGGMGIYLLGGAELGYLIDAKSTSSRSGSEDMDYDLSDDFKNLDMGLTFGMGFQTAPNNGPGFFLESRYALGLTNVADDSEAAQQGYDAQVKTRGIYVFGGMRF